MINQHENNFSEFALRGASDLLRDLSECLEVEFQIWNSSGTVVFKTADQTIAASAAVATSKERIVVPLKVNDEQVGCIVAYSAKPAICSLTTTLADSLSNQYSLEQDLDRLTESLSQSYDEINLLYSFNRTVKPDDVFTKTASDLLAESADFLEERWLSLYLPELGCHLGSPGTRQHDDSCQILSPDNSTSIFDSLSADLRLLTNNSQTPATIRHSGVISTDSGELNYILVPVHINEEMSGFVGLFCNAGSRQFETGEMRLLEYLSEEVSKAATTRELYDELREMLFNTVKGLVAAIDAKDEYTRGHSERVYRYSVLIGERMGISDSQLQDLCWSSLLHDVGKIAIPRSILNKPGRLTDDEFAAIKTHPDKGCKVLEPITQLAHVLPIIRHHHERYGGGGYPSGISGEEIPLLARIIAVADTYDAICSSRAYRPAQTLDYVISELRNGAGKQFDPEVARVMLELIEEQEIARVTEEYKEKTETDTEADQPGNRAA